MDPSQQRAVFFPLDSSVLIVAPPGHGKTFVMTKRISHLLESGKVKPPARILGLTFTNAAAGEMRERIQGDIGPVENVDITTFHSFCYVVLRAYGNVVGVDRKFTVLTEGKAKESLRSILKSVLEEEGTCPPGATQYGDDDIPDEFAKWCRERILKMDKTYTHLRLQAVFEQMLSRFRQRMLEESLIDYDHLLWYTKVLFEEHPEILELFRGVYRYILVDEFQDTNPLQFKLLELLALGHRGTVRKWPARSVFILADPQQAIYEFQGAVPANVEQAKRVFGCATLKLTKNYRTTSPLILSLGAVLRGASTTYAGSELGKVPLFLCPSPTEEAAAVVTQVERLLSEGVPLHEIAILARSGWRLRRVRETLASPSNGIPAVFVPDFSAREIERNHAEIFRALESIIEQREETGRLVANLNRICRELGITPDEDEVLRIMRQFAARYDAGQYRRAPLWERAQSFLNEVLLEINWGEVIRKVVRDKVFVSTIHGVKGLQFEAVIICGLENFLFPSRYICWPCVHTGRRNVLPQIAEESRILYVGITRSRSQVALYASRLGGKNEDKSRQLCCLLRPITDFLNVHGLESGETLEELLCWRKN
ncbi:MAG TPA: ATP-dependent helicase [Thermoflexia bacterium]|nr:ATP-dependent helicase [Thermoflexia bacterium]